MMAKLLDPTVVQGFVYQLEKGEESGILHYQGYVRFVGKKRPVQYFGIKEMSFRKARFVKNLAAYCQKTDTRMAPPVFGGDVRPIRPLNVLAEENLYPWQKEIVDEVKQVPDDRKILWVWEASGGVGKSTFTKFLVVKHHAIVSGGKTADMFNQILEEINQARPPEVVVIDVPRNSLGFINYSAIEKVKDGLFYSGKYEGGMCVYNPPHVIIFANEAPAYDKMSADRWDVREIGGNKSFI